MRETDFRGRRAIQMETQFLRVTVLLEGCHIAEVLEKKSGVNPLWIPPWQSMEPSALVPDRDSECGEGADAKLLAGIMGHNVCLDLFGGPSREEAEAGFTAHGEAPVVPYRAEYGDDELILRADLPLAQIQFERRIALHGNAVRIRETIRNRCAFDRPIGWTQHVTLGPPFLERGVTEFRATVTRSKVYEGVFGAADYLKSGAEFDWPDAPKQLSGASDQNPTFDLRMFTIADKSSAYTAHLMDPRLMDACFVAYSPTHSLMLGYVWRRTDFPWMGIWEENHSRTHSPWNGDTLTRGMEFGVSPYPEARTEMVARGRLFGTDTFLWLPARGSKTVEYWAVAQPAESIPEKLDWPVS
jgi:hypothetical protein